MTPEWLFHVSHEDDVRKLLITKYKIIRETKHRWYVRVRGSEQFIAKRRLRIFTSENELREWLQLQKARQLKTAKRAVEELSVPVSIRLHEVPEERFSKPQDGIPI